MEVLYLGGGTEPQKLQLSCQERNPSFEWENCRYDLLKGSLAPFEPASPFGVFPCSLYQVGSFGIWIKITPSSPLPPSA